MHRPVRYEFCSKCGRTSRWELRGVEKLVYVCMGEMVHHPDLKVDGCGREVAAHVFSFRHSAPRSE